MVRDARRCRAPHHEGPRPHPTQAPTGPREGRSDDELRAVSRDEATAGNKASVAADHVPSSLNLLATSSVIASTAACASGPIAETTIDVPGPAASIIRPMIEVPPTVSPPRVTQTCALKRSTAWTNFAEARAFRPRLLMIRSSLEIAPAGTPVPACGASSLICRRELGWRW